MVEQGIFWERDALISQGSTAVLYDRLYLASDPYTMKICNECNNPLDAKDYCTMCNTDNFSIVQIPYACKLLLQQLQAMSMKIQYIADDK